MRQRVGLAGAGAGNHQQRRRGRAADAMLDGAPLLRIEGVEIGRRWHGESFPGSPGTIGDSGPDRNGSMPGSPRAGERAQRSQFMRMSAYNVVMQSSSTAHRLGSCSTRYDLQL